MFSDTLFRIVNIAGGLGLDDELWRREVLGRTRRETAWPARAAARRRIVEVAAAWRDAALTRIEDLPRSADRANSECRG